MSITVRPLGRSPAYTTVAVFRRVSGLPLSVVCWLPGGVTFRHLLPVGACYPFLVVISRVL
jgi:hypothetical protein